MTATRLAWRAETTEDGSPTLVHPVTGEAMHNRAGAWGETLHVYGQALEAASARGLPLQVLSVGLGLGYCEIVTAAHAVRAGVPVTIASFEADDGLREAFATWLDAAVPGAASAAGRGPGQQPQDLQGGSPSLAFGSPGTAYGEIAARASAHFGVAVESVRHTLATGLTLHGAISDTTTLDQSLTVIFFDAFSAGTSPALWEQALLDHILAHAAPDAVFATYAATGALRRTLTAAGFAAERIDGFAGKRHSTLAVR